MDEDAQTYLWNSLGIDQNYDPTDVRPLHDPDSEDFLWEELIRMALNWDNASFHFRSSRIG
jgi:hypothetical protein